MPSRAVRLLLLLMVVAVAVRVAAVGLLWTRASAPQSYEHGEIAAHLVAGEGFVVRFLGVEGPTSQQAPWYPVLLAGAYAVWGVESDAAHLAVQLLQALVGGAIAPLVAWYGWSTVPDRPRVGTLAGLAAAVFPTHVYMVTHLQVVVWAAAGATALVALEAAPRGRGTTRRGLALGLMAGGLLLVDPILVLAVPVIAVAHGLAARHAPSGRSWFRGAAQAAVVGLVAAAVVAPWVVRNARVHGEFVFVKSTFGYAFWQGNHPLSWGTDKLTKPEARQLVDQHDGTLAGRNRALWEARHETIYIDDAALTAADRAELARRSEPDRSRYLFAQAVEFIRRDPGRYVALCGQRLRYFLLFDETNPKTAQPVYRATSLAWLLLAAAGLAVGWRRGQALGPGWAVFAAVTAFHALTITSARFRIPLEPLSLVWCGLAVDAGLRGLMMLRWGNVPGRGRVAWGQQGRAGRGTPLVHGAKAEPTAR